MVVYLCNILLILLWGMFLVYHKPNNRKKALFCTVASFQWTLISGLRGLSVGADTLNYRRSFNAIGTYSWSKVFHAFFEVYFRGRAVEDISENTLYKDPGYAVFVKFAHIFTDNYQVYLLIVAAILFISLGYFVYKHSQDAVFSYILFSCLFSGFYAVTGIRQTLATALIVFVGYSFIQDNKFVKFVIVALVAFTLHKSSAVFVFFYFLSKIKVNWKYIVAILVALAVTITAGAPFILRIGQMFGYERDEVYESTPYVYLVLMTLMAVAAVIFAKRVQAADPKRGKELNAVLLAGALTALTVVDQSMMRVQQYYALFLMLAIPSMLQCLEKRFRWIVTLLGEGALIALMMQNHPQYVFFWQESHLL